MFFFIDRLDTSVHLNSYEIIRLIRPIETLNLILTDNMTITNRRRLYLYLFKTLLNAVSVAVHFKSFKFILERKKWKILLLIYIHIKFVIKLIMDKKLF